LCRLDVSPIFCFVEDTMVSEWQLVSIRNAQGREAKRQRGKETAKEPVDVGRADGRVAARG